MKHVLVVAAAIALAGCGHSDDGAANQAAANAAQPKKKPAYCFFKDSETKAWTASRGKDGNVVVKGKAYRQDSRYQAVLGPPEVSGTAASIAPTITQNMTGFGARDDWWDVTATIPNSAAIETVTVACGAKTLAELKVPAKR
jgi:hypothetical protein